jgi:hypothetical protein
MKKNAHHNQEARSGSDDDEFEVVKEKQKGA